jgi:N,N'-diacetyllegionaminate synthase
MTYNTKIIAEIGVNHNGKLKNAYKLIDEAKKSGADFVKFQIFKAENVVTKFAKKAKYQKINDNSENQYKMLKKYELGFENIKKLIKYCKKKKIKFLATPFDQESVNFLIKNNQKFIKISSGDINNYPLLKKIGSNKKNVYLSTGMSNLKEIVKAIKILKLNGTKKKNITIFHCTSAYPTPIEETNLNVIKTLKIYFGDNIGYSDHTNSIHIPAYAVLLGAKVIEKHITQNNHDKGPDHSASLNISNFKLMVKQIKKAELSLGSSKKKLTKSERINLKLARRSIYAKKKIKKGEFFSIKNLITKRPANGLSPMNWNKVIGKRAKKNFNIDDKIII